MALAESRQLKAEPLVSLPPSSPGAPEMAAGRERFLPVPYLPLGSGDVGWVAGVGDRIGEFC